VIAFAGKGGVGKTTLAALLLRFLIEEMKTVPVLAIDADPNSNLNELPQLVGHEVVSVAPNVWAVNMEPEAALEEYGMLTLHSRALYKLLFDNKYVRTFFRAVPGMQEWAMLGKAWWHTTELREDGTPKLALDHFSRFAPELGVCQWFHFEDHRLDDGVRWLKQLGVRKLRTGLSWADWLRPDAERWFDRVMRALDDFDVTATFCFTPEHLGVRPHHTSPPLEVEAFADFCALMTRRYAA